ncbi:hypothetical protein [Pseudomonas oryzihabitans]|uniref:hypothetical protein n=1 Tax=Pseudomonas oryzihabitans TaxID=47885 RepID=UPI001D3E6135|nr:hypothetical protein [Pseudomonas oryzihabitans]HJE69829.1 hypothetical protein [Pseudomonas oryzihabitans]
MTDQEFTRHKGKFRRWLDSHGSWFLLLAVSIASWMAGSQHNAVTTADTVKILAESHERQDATRVARIRELLDINQKLLLQVGPRVESAATKAEQAAGKAEEAATKASKAVEVAGKAQE